MISRNAAGELVLGGRPYRFTGINAYEIATNWSVNAGCGGQLSDGDFASLFGSLRPDSVVRFWAYQAQGYNLHTHRVDLTAIDHLVQQAERYRQRLIITLSDQSGTCDDGHWHDGALLAVLHGAPQ